MEPEGSLPCSQGSDTGPYSEPNESTPPSPRYFSKIHSNNITQNVSEKQPSESEWSTWI